MLLSSCAQSILSLSPIASVDLNFETYPRQCEFSGSNKLAVFCIDSCTGSSQFVSAAPVSLRGYNLYLLLEQFGHLIYIKKSLFKRTLFFLFLPISHFH